MRDIRPKIGFRWRLPFFFVHGSGTFHVACPTTNDPFNLLDIVLLIIVLVINFIYIGLEFKWRESGWCVRRAIGLISYGPWHASFGGHWLQYRKSITIRTYSYILDYSYSHQLLGKWKLLRFGRPLGRPNKLYKY